MKQNSMMIAMSGGVDSAVAALLASKGTDAAGVTMRLCSEGIGSTVQANADETGAAAVCSLLKIPHFVADLGQVFRKTVVEPFITAYEQGETPNPCIFCNKAIKFGALLDFAHSKGYQRIATGHYLRLEHTESRTLLRRAADEDKDQSYMLWSLTQDVLSRCEFPLGALTKSEVRELAATAGFPMAQQKDSQDICFVPDGDYAAFIARITGKTPAPGHYIDSEGHILGQHAGQLHYTIGQRKGLGIAMGRPVFVIAKSAADNTVTLGDSEALFSKRLIAKGINLIPYDRLERPRKMIAKARYRQKASPATVEQLDENTLSVTFDTPQRAICPGQSLVLYEDDYLVGGGFITEKS